MSKSSLELIAECQQRGFLSKEAAADVLEKREKIIKQAMFGRARKLIGSVKSQDAPAKAGGLLSKLRVGGQTGRVGKDGQATAGAGWSDVAANLGKMMALAGLTAGATTGAGALIRHSKDKKLRGEIDRSYKTMFKEHPGLNDIEEHDPGRVRRHFGVLARYAPSLAADPTVAGTWVQATSQVGQINTGDIKNLAETQSRIDDAREERGAMKISPLQVGSIASKAMLA